MAWLTIVGELISQWFKRKSEKTQALHEREMAKLQQDGNWDEIHAKNAGASWKDEWFTLLLSVPLIGAFIPPLVPGIMAGFKVLSEMPEFYRAMLFLAVGASFGYRGIMDYLNNKKQ